MDNLPLLQSSNSQFYQTGTDWRTLVIFGAVVLFIIILLTIGNRMSGGSGPKGRRRYSRRQFRREATRIGLTKPQTRLLESFIRTYQVRKPYALLSNTRELNITLGKALRDIDHMEAPDAVVQDRKLQVYRIKQRIDRIFADTNRMATTKQLRLGQNITFQQENGNRFTSVITANLKEFYCAQVPVNVGGEQVKWRKNTRIKLFLWGVDNEEMVFESKVLGYSTVKKISSVILQHTNRIDRAIQRKFRRRKIKAPAYLYPIRIVEKNVGRKVKKHAVVVKNQGRMGSMIDLSAGGCAISTAKSLLRGDLVKLSFEPTRGNPITAFGKVVDIRKVTRSKSILHLMFTRASSKNLNMINEVVYDFG